MRDKEASLNYWERYLAGYQQQAGLPRLSTGNKEAGADYRLEEYDFDIGKEETRGLADLVGKNQVTLNTVFKALWGLVLQKYNNTDDVVFGALVSGRPAGLPGVEKMVGLFINTIPVRIISRPDQGFDQLLRTIQQDSTAGKPHEYLPLADIQSKSQLKANLIDHILIFENYPLYRRLKNTAVPRLPGSPGPGLDFRENNITIEEQTNYDFNIVIIPGEAIGMKLSFNGLVYDLSLIKGVGGHLKKILGQVLENPGVKLKETEILTAEEKQGILFNFNRQEVSYSREKTIHDLFAEQAVRTPDNIALLGPQQIKYRTAVTSISYRELNDRSNQLAFVLIEKGVQTDTIVGIMMDRCLEMIIGIFGILKAGGAYLPIDPGYPRERIDYMIADSTAKILLTSDAINRVPTPHLLPAPATAVSSSTLTSTSTCQVSPTNLAYIIYTSGSTGRPKGVMVEQPSAVNILEALQNSYPLMESDVYLLKTSFIFDVSVTELFGWFLGGGRLAVLEKGGEKDPGKILDTIARERVTHINFVPSVFNVFLEVLNPGNVDKLSGLRYIFLAGEALLPEVVKKYIWLDISASIALENIYGPTEGTVYTSAYGLSSWKGEEVIPIGKPLANTRVYILDQYDRLQPIGISGELCIGGIGLARGYLNRPELTAERFDQDYPNEKLLRGVQGGGFLEKSPPGRRRQNIFKTGDLARWLPDGNIEFLGRMDSQVKIRGFRIEPGEIENQILTNKMVKEAVVIAKEKEDGDKYLAAYWVPRSVEGNVSTSGDAPDLREYLSQRLPDYMVPSYYVRLDKIPLTASGKVDRKALPVPGPGFTAAAGDTAPRNEIEKKLARIWLKILFPGANRPPLIGIDENFFQLGGHSLTAAALITFIHKEFHVNVSPALIFEKPDIRRLAQYISGHEKDKHTSIPAVEKKEYYKLSSAQESIYIMHHMESESILYNMQNQMLLEGDLDTGRWEKAFRCLIRRHESFRTSFHMKENEPVQRIHDRVEFEIEYCQVKVKVEEKGQKTEDRPGTYLSSVFRHLSSEFIRPFDLSQTPLLRVGLIKLLHTPTALRGHPRRGTYNSQEGIEHKYILILDMHHIVYDGISLDIFVKELMHFYRYGDNKRNHLPALRLQYKDFSVWQNSRKDSKAIRKQETYWLDEFKNGIPGLDIRGNFKGASTKVKDLDADNIDFQVNSKEARALKKLALSEGITLFMVLLAAYNILLAKLCQQEDIVVGTPSAGRMHADLEGIIGPFINMLAFRNQPAGEKTVKDFLREVKERTLKAYENQDYRYEQLVDRLLQGGKFSGDSFSQTHSLFDVVFLFQNMENLPENIPGLEVPGLKLTPMASQVVKLPYNMVLTGFEMDEALKFSISYREGLVTEETIGLVIENFKKIISAVLKDKHIKIEDIKVSHGLAAAESDISREGQGDFDF